MKTLGIIGGMSPESTSIYYNEINQLINQKLGGNASAPLVLFSVEFAEIVALQQSGKWQEAGAILADIARKLEQIGAEGIVLATNTMHKVADAIMDAIDIPFLHILDATAQVIHQQQIKKVAVLGTKFTMSDDFYRMGLLERNLTPIFPDEDDQNKIHQIIFNELCVGKFLPESKQFYLNVIDKLKTKGAGGVILGCTEIGLLINQQDSQLPFFDSAKLHAEMAAHFILENGK